MDKEQEITKLRNKQINAEKNNEPMLAAQYALQIIRLQKGL